MSLESDLEELELYLGHNPLHGVKHPNPKRRYKKNLFKALLNKFKKKSKNNVWGQS